MDFRIAQLLLLAALLFAGCSVQTSPHSGRPAGNLRLVGALRLPPPSDKAYGDLAVYGDLAFIGRSRFACANSAVDIIDIADPAQPRVLTTTLPLPDAATEDVQAMRIGDRDVLVVGLQACGNTTPPTSGSNGIDLWDISDPQRPERLAFWKTPLGVHEFGLATLPDGRAVALLAVPDLEDHTATAGGQSTGDLLIVDISDPANPRQLGEWGVVDAPELGRDFAAAQGQGVHQEVYLHSVRAGPDGQRAYLSYWDAGVIILDISDPSRPRYLGRTTFEPFEEGNAHSVALSADQQLMIQADEDISPQQYVLRSSAFEGYHVIQPLGILSSEATWRPVTGTLALAGGRCPDASAASDTALEGKVALLQAGDCSWPQKIAQAQLDGAAGVILYDTAAVSMPDELREGPPLAAMPDGENVLLRTPGIYVDAPTAQALLAATSPVTVESTIQFDGWGGIRLFDISNPAAPAPLATYTTASDHGTAFGEWGPWWTAHDPFLEGSTLYVSWYTDGVRMLDVSNPRSPREISSWAGQGAPDDAPEVFIWGVVAHKGYVFAADMSFGLYVLRLEP